ncbi:MAG: hypothetical protein HKL96_07995 [Phycisphaerales bacterium]|nr:hypothetical protein [Phycisphaerales bacterium]
MGWLWRCWQQEHDADPVLPVQWLQHVSPGLSACIAALEHPQRAVLPAMEIASSNTMQYRAIANIR